MSLKRKKKKSSTLKRLRQLIKEFTPYNDYATLIIACLLADVNLTVHYNSTKGMIGYKLQELFNTVITNEYDDIDCGFVLHDIQMPRLRDLSKALVNLIVRERHTFSDAETVFANPYPEPTTLIKQQKIIKLRNKLITVSFPKEIKEKILNIIHVIEETDEAFMGCNVHKLKPVIQAFALLGGRKVVSLEDLKCMADTWNTYEMEPTYRAAVDSILMGYSGLAIDAEARVDVLVKRVSGAKAALDHGNPINYYDDSISSDMTLGQIIAEAAGELTQLNGKLRSLTEGQPKSNALMRPLFSVISRIITEIEKMKKMQGIH